MRRIAVALEYPLMQQGGTEVLIRELLRGLSPHFEIVLVSGDRDLRELPAELGRMVHSHVHWSQGPADSAPAKKLAIRLKDLRVELAHFHFGGTYEWASNRWGRCPVPYVVASGVPCVSTNHLVVEWLNCGVHPKRPFPYKLMAQGYAWLSRALVFGKVTWEICVSKEDQRNLRRMFPLFRNKIGQCYHSLLAGDEPSEETMAREAVVLCAGAICRRKGQTKLVEAFANIAQRYPDWQLLLVGRVDSLDDERQIRNCATHHGISERVKLTGALSHAETLQLMRGASIIAMPSLLEGLGLSLQEALYYGCVAVGSRIGGIPELIEHEGNGLLVPPADIGALGAALDRLLSSEELREKFRRRARPSIVEKGMTAPRMIRNYLQLYERLAL